MSLSDGQLATLPHRALAQGAARSRRVFTRTVLLARLRRVGWTVASLSLFIGGWEASWALGVLDPLIMPPPHIFLAEIANQGQFFSSTVGESSSGSNFSAVQAMLSSAGRVLAGLFIGFVTSLVVGLAISLSGITRNLALPTITLLAPISPIAWLPVAVLFFGIGNAPAIFTVFLGVFFIMTLATISAVEQVGATYVNVARTLGATRSQEVRHVIIPAVMPQVFVVLRINLFAAWMVVLIAEAIGVGTGLGQLIIAARNTFNADLAFLAMTLIGITGYLLDVVLRQMQRRLFPWQPGMQASAA
ncbi:MAG: ABC transporter permease [Solirubrobacteraceae bacterium MAG38_C4-C5]|nr:ABC transporter permease [Candidatus Siliceabacter maunaloa]